MRLKTNILITGKKGQLGRQLAAILGQLPPSLLSENFIFTEREQLDITNFKAVELFIKRNSISVIINCAAYTAVDRAEEERELAFLINGEAVANLARVAKKEKILLIHLSTDYLYSGHSYRPYIESDPVAPQNSYGESKAQGERAIVEADGRYIIVRTSWLYSQYGANFVKTIERLAQERDSLKVVFDQIGSPTYGKDLALVLLKIVTLYFTAVVEEREEQFPYGIYNYSNEGVASWYDFATEILSLKGVSNTIEPVRSEQFPTAAKRPLYGVMDKSKIKESFGITIPHWRSSLKQYFESLNKL